ncbi:CheR family methyltransferase [Vibrio nomapromontoriensis]|uniref:CheR family methyltransferase n=1 Tax=Vibrio nomapromontoriensis TaxID=2910246 RepID=UPI003D110DAA
MLINTQFDYTEADFNAIASLAYSRVGISLHKNKKNLVYNRLISRVRANRLVNFAKYIQLLDDESHIEWEYFVNALTTNLTYFFREHYHFELLKAHVHEYFAHSNVTDPVRVWCSACSTGEEAYSIAMAMVEAFGTSQPPVKILATDLNTHVLSIARKGYYTQDQLERVTEGQKHQFFIAHKHNNIYEIKPEIKALVHFKRLNLMDGEWPMKKNFDAIFCRNVMIYFDRKTQRSLLDKFAHYLPKGALLFLGHSESFSGHQSQFILLRQTTYKRV